MARIRTVKPEYPKHRKTRSVSRNARLLNIHLWNLADDEGRLQELPQWIIGEIFPTDEDVSPAVLGGWLDELEEVGFVLRYEVEGERYIQCHDFTDHQKISHARQSVLPSPEPFTEASVKPPGTVPEPSGQEGNGMEQGTGNGTGRPKGPVELTLDQEAQEDFALWQRVTGHQDAVFNPERRKCYRARRKQYDRERCQLAIHGAGTPKARAKDGTLYDDWRTIFRNGTNLEMYEGFAKEHRESSDQAFRDRMKAAA